eukprot:2449315-Amphidinium_carterae.1
MSGSSRFNVPVVPVLGEGCSAFRFTLQSTPQAVWPYSREEYHRLTYFMSRCVVATTPGPEFPHCFLLAEVMLGPLLQKHSTFVSWTRRWGLPQMQGISPRGFAPPQWARARL